MRGTIAIIELERTSGLMEKALSIFHNEFNRTARTTNPHRLTFWKSNKESPPMYRAMYTAATGMETQQRNLENVANNLANANTTGFHRRRMQFQDLVYQNVVLPGAAATQQTTFPTGLQIGLGARTSASEIIQQQGDFTETDNPLDMEIEGQGFFQVQLPDGTIAYTRSGDFHLDSTGIIVTSDGNQLQPAITIPPSATNITIGTDGTVSAQLPGSAGPAGRHHSARHFCQSRRPQ